MSARQSPSGSGVAGVVAKRLGAALALALVIAFARGLWEGALEAFAEGAGAGLGGIAVALVITAIALVLVYATLGSQVEAVAVRLSALAVGAGDATFAGDTKTARADLAATPIFAGLGAWLAHQGVRDADGGRALLGFAALALAGLSLVSAITHARTARRHRSTAEGALDAERARKGGEMAAIFASAAVLSLTLSSAILAAAPALRGGSTILVPPGDWVKACVGNAAGCGRSRVLAIAPERGRATLIEVIGANGGALRARGRSSAVDAAGAAVKLSRAAGTESTWRARFVPAPRTTYELVFDTPGLYTVRWRNAP